VHLHIQAVSLDTVYSIIVRKACQYFFHEFFGTSDKLTIHRKVVIMAANIQCPNCKEPISPEARSCPHCGIQLQTQVHKSGLTPGELKRPLPDVVKQFDASATTNITIA